MRRSLPYHLTTLFLFTRSDFKTVILPQSVFALSLVVSRSNSPLLYGFSLGDIAYRMPYMLVWLWLHLLVEDISNQSLSSSIVEDTINRPWRPLPARRLTVTEARNITRVAVVAALALSIFLKSFLPSTTLMTLIWLYNDLDGNSTGPLMRNVLNGAGLACFGWGAVCVLLEGATDDGNVLRDWLILVAAMISTTVHVQDLADKDGDKARKRQTAALIYGEGWTRWSVAIVAIFWSVVCPAFWGVSLPYATAPLGISSIMSAVLLLGKSQFSNELGLRLWCLWVTVVFISPLLGGESV
ncbi:UbiA prenyltransferase family-domain-containing protein [Xylaria bambusicola]|uniref:UbiA prenyltransferase family-domain-containing protein n=1 Tax=Xylaria bambusicola TaxID=326684 RepID=UPI0020079932|nr:UbiA prenyltransferase family-domain-containing protein [Xylaria bambusicola]KAI0518478.1 UbiA prenyltransferase family-domain-containing protein [Xylaria bambusicola]